MNWTALGVAPELRQQELMPHPTGGTTSHGTSICVMSERSSTHTGFPACPNYEYFVYHMRRQLHEGHQASSDLASAIRGLTSHGHTPPANEYISRA